MKLTKDTYLYLLNFSSDKDVVNMLSVNKKFSNDKNFEVVIKNRYPLLIKRKKSWKCQYIKIIYYNAYLEKLGIPYIPCINYNPKDFYRIYRSERNLSHIVHHIIHILINSRTNYDILAYMLQKFKRLIIINDFICDAVRSTDINVLKVLFENGATNFVHTLFISSYLLDMKIVKFAIENGLSYIEREEILEAIHYANDDEIKKYLYKFV